MTPRFPTSARFRRHQRSMPLLPILGAALLTGGGLFFLLKSPDPSETVNKQPQAPLNGAEQGLRSPLPAPKATAVAKTSSHAQAESRLVIKTDNRWVSVKEGTPLSQPNNKAIPSTDRRQINTAMGGQSKLKPASDSRYEHMLEIRAEKKLETAANKRVSRGDGGNAMAGAKAQMRPLSQPDRAQKAAFTSHPLPRTLPPKLREQEMDLTFYKGLANKKIILPEEPTEKQGRPRIWAGLSPRTTDAGRAYGPRDFAKATIKLTRQKLAQSSEATADAHKPSASTKKMSQNTKKRSTTATIRNSL